MKYLAGGRPCDVSTRDDQMPSPDPDIRYNTVVAGEEPTIQPIIAMSADKSRMTGVKGHNIAAAPLRQPADPFAPPLRQSKRPAKPKTSHLRTKGRR